MINYDNSKNPNVILPVKNSIVRTWPEDCFLLSIIQNNEKAYDWIMNFFVQIVVVLGDNGERRITFYPSGAHHKKVNLYDFCPFINKYIIPRKLLIESFITFDKFLIYAIDNGLYVSNVMEQFFRTLSNNRNYFFHPNYFYGYNLNRQAFYIMDNFNSGKFESNEVSFSLINESYCSLDNFNWSEYETSTYLYEVNNSTYEFNHNVFISNLRDYLESYNTLGYLDSYIRPQDKNIFYGISCYDYLSSYLKKNLRKNLKEHIDLRSFVFLIDHKTLMKLRIAFLINRGYLAENKLLRYKIELLENECTKVVNLIIKYNITYNNNIIFKVLKNIDDIKSKDMELTQNLLDVL